MFHNETYTLGHGKIKASILVVDDDVDILTTARVVLRQKFEVVVTENNPARLLTMLEQQHFDVLLLDMNFSSGKTSGNEGLYWLKQVQMKYPPIQVVMVTAYGDIKLAVEAMKHGAADFIVKPWDNEKLEATVHASWQLSATRKELSELKNVQSHLSRIVNAPDTEFIANAPAMRQLVDLIDKVARTDANILLLGENGTGKELVAKRIHQQSLRNNNPFVKIDVGSIAPSLFESELFGHRKGAFTDAREDRIGRMELANDGTLFIDEIGNLSLNLQVKLLSALQNREVVPLGGGKPVRVNLRLISATNLDIHHAVDSGTFREDLLYRINTIELVIPPLRDRTDDIPGLAKHFLALYCTKYRKEAKSISSDALRYLQKYHWPGNVRELQHAMERAVIMSDHAELTKSDFVFSSRKKQEGKKEIVSLDDMERNAIINAIEKHEGNMSKVARELGVGRTTLYRKMSRYGIDNKNA